MTKTFTALSVVLAAACLAPAANAADILGLYNTGVDDTGAVLAAGQQDSHYLISGADSYVVAPNSSYVTSTTAGYVAPAADGSGGSATYTLTFDLSGLDASTAQLSGSVAYDNDLQIYLNNNLLYSDQTAAPGAWSAFMQLNAFSASSADFVGGLNTLTFVVTDFTPPTGLMVTGLAGTAAAVPEPASWAMMVGGFGLLGAALRRKKAVVHFA